MDTPTIISLVIGVLLLSAAVTLVVMRATRPTDGERKHPPTMLPANRVTVVLLAGLVSLGVGIAVFMYFVGR